MDAQGGRQIVKYDQLAKQAEGFAETLAYASLIYDGFDCRLVGQDSGRGTFFHRHAVLHSQTNTREYVPLSNLVDRPNSFRVIDSGRPVWRLRQRRAGRD